MEKRIVSFNFNNVDIDWTRKGILTSCTSNALSLMFPLFEKFVSKLFRNVEVKNEKLKEEVKLFIFQEANHAKWHIEFNKKLDTEDFDSTKYTKLLNLFLNLLEKTPTHFQVNFASAFEHLTFIFSEIVLKGKVFDEADPEVKRFWEYHAIEEFEHRTVCFDLFREFSSSYLYRQIGYLTLLIVFVICFLEPFLAFILLRHKEFEKRIPAKEITKNSVSCLRHWVSYFKPNFHPIGSQK